jgi:hypothetical protein
MTGSIPTTESPPPRSESPYIPDLQANTLGTASSNRAGTEDEQEQAALLARAASLQRAGDIVGARLLLQRAADKGAAVAVFLLAQTYDPHMLSRWQVRGIRGDQAKAQQLYAQARASGVVAE